LFSGLMVFCAIVPSVWRKPMISSRYATLPALRGNDALGCGRVTASAHFPPTLP
jgi:hypothetical protein